MNILDFLRNKLSTKPASLKADDVVSLAKDKVAVESYRKFGVIPNELKKIVEDSGLINYERMGIYQVVDRALCLEGDTRISLLDARYEPTIKEMAENPNQYVGKYVLSVNPTTKAIEPDKILAVQKTATDAQLIRVNLDNGKYVDCTPDHRFMLRDGSYQEAKNLKVNDSLMPLYVKFPTSGKLTDYLMVFRPDIGKYSYIHRLVIKFFKGKLTKNWVIHHKNFTEVGNKLNNDPSNLEEMPKIQHTFIHNNGRKGLKCPHKSGCKCITCRKLRGEKFPSYAKRIYPRVMVCCQVCSKLFEVALDKLQLRRPRKTCSEACRKVFVGKALAGRKRVFHNLEQFKATCSIAQKKRFEDPIQWEKQYKHLKEKAWPNNSKLASVVNHKVVSIEVLSEKKDAYDITTERNHNFPLACGIFVHNCHPLMSAAVGVFTDYATVYNRENNATVWVTSESKEYRYQIEKLLDVINIEEVIYDWAWTASTFGDLFVRNFGEPGVGITSVSDDDHPSNVSRIDYNGRLVGFYETPFGNIQTSEHKLLPPWEYVHFRVLGSKRRRPIYQDYNYCLEGNTKIVLCDGTRPTIKEMAENCNKFIGKSILSINPITKAVEPDEIVNVKKTRLNTQLIRVNLDNGKYVDCTPDHRFMLRDGSYQEAKNLKTNDSLMPFYSKISEKGLPGYNLVYNPACGKYCYEHRLVATKEFGKILRGKVVHHKDFTKINNDKSNLQPMIKKEHVALHNQNHDKRTCQCNRCVGHQSTCSCSVCKQTRNVSPIVSRLCVICNKQFLAKEHIKKECCSKVCGNKLSAKTRMLNRQYVPCQCGCGEIVEIISDSVTNRHKIPFVHNHNSFVMESKDKFSRKIKEFFKEKVHRSDCGCIVCKKQGGRVFGFNVVVSRTCTFCGKHFESIKVSEFANHIKKCKLKLAVLNHKVVSVEWLNEPKDTYDLETKFNHNFPLDSGVFVHNSEFRTINILTPDSRRLTSKYGQSILLDALPTWKRLRLVEDSIMMSRISRGVLRYLYKINVGQDGSNPEAVAELIDSYVQELKRARALDTSASNPNYADRYGAMAGLEDLVVPVWGDVNNIAVEKLGGEVDIKWIADVEELRNQLSTALKVPLAMLSGYVAEGTPPGGLGQSSLDRLDIRFARQARRIQRTLICGITRLAQIHLAYQGMDPDPKLFEIHMSETSSAEEEELKDALDKGVDIVGKFMELVEGAVGEIDLDKKELLDYLNKKYLKLNDLDLEKMLKKGNPNAFKTREETPVPGVETPPEEALKEPNPFREGRSHSDLKSYLPINEGTNDAWIQNWHGKTVKVAK